jgi:hypothetical protein
MSRSNNHLPVRVKHTSSRFKYTLASKRLHLLDLAYSKSHQLAKLTSGRYPSLQPQLSEQPLVPLQSTNASHELCMVRQAQQLCMVMQVGWLAVPLL